MKILFFCVLSVLVKCQDFPTHLDLQLIGDVNFKNTKYNVLEPSVHLVTDYFTDTVLRRDTNGFPTKRVFVDHNGFRHYWSSLEKQLKSLRKADLGDQLIKTTLEEIPGDKNVYNDVGVINTEDPIENIATDRDVVDEDAVIEEENHKTQVENSKEDAQEIEDTVETTTFKLTPKRRKKVNLMSVNVPLKGDSDSDEINALRTDIEKVRIKFFCPFFGVITMTSKLQKLPNETETTTIKATTKVTAKATTKVSAKPSAATKPTTKKATTTKKK